MEFKKMISLCSIPAGTADEELKFAARSKEGVPPKIAIVALVRWMEKNGYSQDSYDYIDLDMLMLPDEDIYNYFKQLNPAVIGMSAVTSSTYKSVKRIAALARKACADALIVLGGNMAASAEVVLVKTEVDICVVGDGEIAWVELLSYAKENGNLIKDRQLSNIQGLAYLHEDTDQLVFTGYGRKIDPENFEYIPDYELLIKGLKNRPELLRNYFFRGKGHPYFRADERSNDPARGDNCAYLWATKGCVARCTFCQRSTKGYRTLDMDRVRSHLSALKTKHNVGFIQVADENFGSDRAQALRFAELMKEFDFLWVAMGMRCDSVTEETIKRFAECNCTALKFGVESGSQTMLNIMEKKYTVGEIAQAHRWCANYNIWFNLGMLVGMPGETSETVEESSKMIAEIALLGNKSPAELMGYAAAYPIPFPGTPLYEYGKQLGVIGGTPDEEENFLIYVTAADSFKYFYVNLNGAEPKEALYWEALLMMEANRIFYKTKQAERKPITGAGANTVGFKRDGQVEPVKAPDILSRIINRIKKGGFLRSLYFPRITTLTYRYLIQNEAAYRLPASLHKMLVKNLCYLEFVLLRIISILRGRPDLFSYAGVNCKRLDAGDVAGLMGKKLASLRTVALSRRKNSGDDASSLLLAGM